VRLGERWLRRRGFSHAVTALDRPFWKRLGSVLDCFGALLLAMTGWRGLGLEEGVDGRVKPDHDGRSGRVRLGERWLKAPRFFARGDGFRSTVLGAVRFGSGLLRFARNDGWGGLSVGYAKGVTHPTAWSAG
jgi:hypothetical protein